MNKIGGFWSELSYVPDLKLDTEYTLVIGDNSYTSTCQLGQDLQSREILFFNQNIYIRTNWDGNAGVYKEGVTFVRHYDTTEFKLYEAGAEEIASAIAFENNDGVLGHIGMVNDSGSELLRLTPDGQASYRVVDEGNFTDIITYSNIGAAPAYHGEHFSLGEGSNNAYYGDKGKIAYDHSQSAHAPSNAQKNSDITKAEIEAKLTGNITSHTHNYAGSSSAGGAATSANKVNSNLVIKINGGTNEGTNMFTFNGSAGKTIDIKASALGAPASHTHDDRYYTETEINTKLSDMQGEINDALTGYNTDLQGEIERAENAEEALRLAINNEVTRATAAEAKALTDANSYTDAKVAAVLDSAPETLDTLNELAAALGDDPNFATTIANQIGGKAPTSHASTATTYGAASASNYGHAKASGTTPKANGTAAVGSETSSFARGDHVHPLQTSVSGNAGTATKFASAQSVALTGDVTGSASSQAGWSVATTLSNSGVTAGSYGQAENASPAHQGTFSVPYITVDAKGRVTSAVTRTITLPKDNNTTYSAATTSANGLMTSAMVTKLNGIATGAEVNQNAFANVKVGDTTIAADAKQDTLTLVAGSNVTITPDATNDKITIAATDTVYTHPTSGATAGSYGPSANATPAYGATFNVPYLTVNAAGHVTAISTKTVKIPASDNTWRGIQNSLTSTSTTDSLSAAQGKILNDTKADMIEDTELTTMLTTIFGTAAASLDE